MRIISKCAVLIMVALWPVVTMATIHEQTVLQRFYLHIGQHWLREGPEIGYVEGDLNLDNHVDFRDFAQFCSDVEREG